MPTPTHAILLGLEHTGHHWWNNMTGDHPQVCSSSASWSSFRATKNQASLLDQLALDMRNEVGVATGHAENGSIGRSRCKLRDISMCSYPCGTIHEIANPYRNPDVLPVQRASQLAGASVDLRILLFHRTLVEIVHHFNQLRLIQLLHGCHTLRDQLLLLDAEPNATVSCFDYHQMPQEAARLSAYLGIDVRHQVRASFRTTTRGKRSREELGESLLEKVPLWHELSACHEDLGRYCAAHGQEAAQEGQAGAEGRGWGIGSGRQAPPAGRFTWASSRGERDIDVVAGEWWRANLG